MFLNKLIKAFQPFFKFVGTFSSICIAIVILITIKMFKKHHLELLSKLFCSINELGLATVFSVQTVSPQFGFIVRGNGGWQLHERCRHCLAKRLLLMDS